MNQNKVIPAWKHHYRIIASSHPPINFFETLVPPELLEELFYIEGLTNDRLRDEVGDITLIDAADRVSGPGSSPVMAAFTHVGLESRFTDGSFGIYYAGDSLKTAIKETRFHRQQFLEYTKEEAGEIDMRAYIGEFFHSMEDIRIGYDDLHNPDNWSDSQLFGQKMKKENAWGITYRSVRNPGGECVAILRPPAITIPNQGPHLSYVWDGSKITHVYEKKRII